MVVTLDTKTNPTCTLMQVGPGPWIRLGDFTIPALRDRFPDAHIILDGEPCFYGMWPAHRGEVLGLRAELRKAGVRT